jgi:hypothetical protein
MVTLRRLSLYPAPAVPLPAGVPGARVYNREVLVHNIKPRWRTTWSLFISIDELISLSKKALKYLKTPL